MMSGLVRLALLLLEKTKRENRVSVHTRLGDNAQQKLECQKWGGRRNIVQQRYSIAVFMCVTSHAHSDCFLSFWTTTRIVKLFTPPRVFQPYYFDHGNMPLFIFFIISPKIEVNHFSFLSPSRKHVIHFRFLTYSFFPLQHVTDFPCVSSTCHPDVGVDGLRLIPLSWTSVLMRFPVKSVEKAGENGNNPVSSNKKNPIQWNQQTQEGRAWCNRVEVQMASPSLRQASSGGENLPAFVCQQLRVSP